LEGAEKGEQNKRENFIIKRNILMKRGWGFFSLQRRKEGTRI